MTSKLTVISHFALAFLLLGMGAHILGFVTDFWCTGSRDKGLRNVSGSPNDSLTDSDVLRVNIGLFDQTVEYENGVVTEEDSSLKLMEEQILIIAIAGTNTLLSLIIYIRAVHIFVGISSFIVMTLMLLSTFFTFEHTDANMGKLQDYHSKWPTLELSWSFICVFCGLIVNIISTALFLTMVLIKGENKAAKSSRGLGPTHDVDTNDKTPIVSVISGDQSYGNVSYANEYQNNSNTDMPDSANANSSFPATDPVYVVDDEDIVIEDKNKRKHPLDSMQENNLSKSDYTELFHTDSRVPDEPYTDLDAVESDDNTSVKDNSDMINTVSESIHL